MYACTEKISRYHIFHDISYGELWIKLWIGVLGIVRDTLSVHCICIQSRRRREDDQSVSSTPSNWANLLP